MIETRTSVEAAIPAATDAAETQPVEFTDTMIQDQLSPVRPMQQLENVSDSTGPLKRTNALDAGSSSSDESAEEEGSTSDESVDPVECHIPYVIDLESDDETVLSPKKPEMEADIHPATVPPGSSAAPATAPPVFVESPGPSKPFSPEIQDSQVAGDFMEGGANQDFIVSDEEVEVGDSTQKGVFKDSYCCSGPSSK